MVILIFIVASYNGYGRCCAVLLIYGANHLILNLKNKTPKEEAKGDAINVFDIFMKKVHITMFIRFFNI
jgi:hypothetical protein